MTVLRQLVRDGTIVGPGGTEIDVRTPDSGVWITVKGESDALTEAAATELLDLVNRVLRSADRELTIEDVEAMSPMERFHLLCDIQREIDALRQELAEIREARD